MGYAIAAATRPLYGGADPDPVRRPGPGDPPPTGARADLRFSHSHFWQPHLSHLHLVVREGGSEDGYGKAPVGADEQPSAGEPVDSSAGTDQGGHSEIPDPFQDADALEELEERIVVLASHIHAAEHRFLLLIAEFDKRGGWKLAGHRNCAEWLHFRTGIARGAAREKVRAARALEKLPLTSEAMSRGELSFSKVRAITRLADDLSESENPEAEAEVVEVAKEVTAASLEKIVRGWRFMSGLDEVELERRRHRSRYLSVAPDGEGMYVVRGKLDPEVGALLMRTLEAAGKALYRKGEDWAAEGGPRGPQAEETAPRQRRADAIGLACERALAAGFGRGVDDADDEGGDGEPEEHDAPISGTRAERYQVFLHVDMDTLAGEDESDPPGACECGSASGPPSQALTEPCGRGSASGGRSHLHDGTRVSAETSRRLCCDAAVVKVTRGPDGSVLDIGRKTRKIPPAIRRALEVRDGGCRFPGCGLRFTDGHHIVFWGDGGPTKLSNLVLLCWHHHRCVHEGGFKVRMRGDGTLQFHDRTGWPLPDFAPLSRLEPGPVERLQEENRRHGVDPHRDTPSATWKRDVDVPWEAEARMREALDPA